MLGQSASGMAVLVVEGRSLSLRVEDGREGSDASFEPGSMVPPPGSEAIGDGDSARAGMDSSEEYSEWTSLLLGQSDWSSISASAPAHLRRCHLRAHQHS